ncbi:MAG: hypothetical protein AAGD25_19965 [Cyanobacteria bacterium P01_F01_bin.150]
MVNEHSTNNPEPQGSEHSSPDKVDTDSLAQSHTNLQPDSDSTHNDVDSANVSTEDKLNSETDINLDSELDAEVGNGEDVSNAVDEDEETDINLDSELDAEADNVEEASDAFDEDEKSISDGDLASATAVNKGESSQSEAITDNADENSSETSDVEDKSENFSLSDSPGNETSDEHVASNAETPQIEDKEPTKTADDSFSAIPDESPATDNALTSTASVTDSATMPSKNQGSSTTVSQANSSGASESKKAEPQEAESKKAGAKRSGPNVGSAESNIALTAWQQIQPILSVTGIIVLTTSIQWLNLGQEALKEAGTAKAKEAKQGNSGDDSILVTIWKIVQPILITVLSFSSRILSSGMGQLLSKLDTDAYAAVEDGTASTLPERIQSMPAGDKVWDVLETIWKLWTGLLGFLRDRIFPESIRHWSNRAITALVAFVVIFIMWISSSLSPSPAQEVVNGSNAISGTSVVSGSNRAKVSQKVSSSKYQNIAASIQKRLTKQLSVSYSDDLIQGVTIDQPLDLLTVVLGQGWYDLSDRQQRRLAQTIFDNTDDASFSHLRLINIDGVRIARNPVVGSDMILYQTVPPVIEEPVIEEPVIEAFVIEDPVIEEPVEKTAVEPITENTEEAETVATEDAAESR